MSDAIDTVTAFIGAWGQTADDFRAALRGWFTDQTVWENVGIAKTTGVEEALGFFDGFAKKVGFATFTVEMINIAAAGAVVLTERVDRAILPNGKLAPGGLRVMGAFEVEGGKITAWRDYVDTAPFQK